MLCRLCVSLVYAVLLPWVLWAETPEPQLALKGLDPIALAEGKETPGLAAIEVSQGLFRYRFANEENKKAFLANPIERGIQFGGACGKMGPFSGNGHPDRFHVHDRRIYVFASEGCRTAFKADPESFIEKPDSVPTGTEAEKLQGDALVTLALKGFGGAEAVDQIKSFASEVKAIYVQNGKETVGRYRSTWSFPGEFRFDEIWSTPYGQVIGKDNFQFAGKKAWSLGSDMVAIARRQALRDPLTMLCLRKSPGFVAFGRGQATVDGTTVNLVDVALDGVTMRWAIDRTTGQVLTSTFQARRGKVATVMMKYGDFKPVDGITIPMSRQEWVNGKQVASPKLVVEPPHINQALPASTFQRPQ